MLVPVEAYRLSRQRLIQWLKKIFPHEHTEIVATIEMREDFWIFESPRPLTDVRATSSLSFFPSFLAFLFSCFILAVST